MTMTTVKTAAGLVAVAVAVLVGAGAGCTQPARVASRCLVVDKDRTGSQTADFDMRVYTENCGTFKVADEWGKTDSADIYGSIRVGKVYDITYRGTRNPDWSRFPNIVSVQEVQP